MNRVITIVLSLMIGAVGFIGCTNDNESKIIPFVLRSNKVLGVMLNKNSTTILVGGTEQLTATVVPSSAANKNVTWEPDDELVATVSPTGLVTAVDAGTTDITVITDDGGFTAICTVTVSSVPVPVTGVSLNKNSTTLALGDTEQLTADIDPDDATNQNLTWLSGDDSVATVSSVGLVTAIGGGNTSIIVITKDGFYSDTCLITVLGPSSMVTFSADNVDFNMAYVPGGMSFASGAAGTVTNDFWIAETEVTYELWYKVHSWAIANGYTFQNPGREGNNGTITNPAGEPPTGAMHEPATTMNWRDAMIWCNAATEWYNAKNGTTFTCVYYSDSSYTTPIKNSVDGIYGSSINPNDGGFDKPYIKAASNGNFSMVNCTATGFRLLANNEWNLAARYKGDYSANGAYEYPASSGYWWTPGDYASGATANYIDFEASGIVGWYDGNSDNVTHVVKDKVPNALGLYDMSGNAYEWVFEWHTTFGSPYRMTRGCCYRGNTNGMRVDYESNDAPYLATDCVGLRIAKTY